MSEIDRDNLPPSTVPKDLSICVKGFENDEAARKLGHAVLECLNIIGSFIDLATLDGVTIATDYDAALASLDRGIKGLKPLTRSNTAEMEGAAMAPAVMRDGEVLTHLVFDAAQLAVLIADGAKSEDLSRAIGIIAHESAHVQITAQKERAIPEARFGTEIKDYEKGVMFPLADACWDEYAACRLSALFSPKQNSTHSLTLSHVVPGAKSKADEAIKRYRLHGDIGLLVREAGSALCQPIKVAAYLLGGMDASGEDWGSFPEVRAVIADAKYTEFIDELHEILRHLWDTQEEWSPTLGTFAPLEELAKRVFNSGGISFQSNGRIDVPFTPSTMPEVKLGCT